MTAVGLYCRLHDEDCETIGFAHLPPPIELEDLVATVNGAFRVVDVVVSPPGYPIEALVQVRPVRDLARGAP